MSFLSLSFFVFLPAVLFLSFLTPARFRYITLFAAGLLYYYLADPSGIPVLGLCILLTYTGGLFLGRKAGSRGAGAFLALFLVLNLGILIVLKYSDLAAGLLLKFLPVSGIGGMDRQGGSVLPVAVAAGLSFYIFQSSGYLIDVYRGKTEPESNPVRYALFVSFFPLVLSGPIERAGNLLPQLKQPKPFSADRTRDGLLIMLWGYFLKLVIAERVSIFVDAVYASAAAAPGTVVLTAFFLYPFQIYCDFAGYSSMARGTALALGYEVTDNFRAPYLAESIADYWRRWHISLSTWFRDYLYIPLGGNRRGKAVKCRNLLIVFAVSGLWHGASVNFLIWGLLHGIYQVIGNLLRPFREKLELRSGAGQGTLRKIHIAATFLLVTLAWPFFCTDTFGKAVLILKKCFSFTPWVFTDGSLYAYGLDRGGFVLLLLALAVLFRADAAKSEGRDLLKEITGKPLALRWILYLAAAAVVLLTGCYGPGYNAAGFIYQQF